MPKLLPSFAGAVHDFTKSLKERAKARKHCGPYHWTPCEPGGSRGFYQAQGGLYCDRSGSIFDLRLSEANGHLDRYSRLARINGYFCDDDGCGDTLQPIVARLPHGRGFLAGWTMGRGMCGAIDLAIYDEARDAAIAAHNMAEMDAERNRIQSAMDEEPHDNDNEEG